MISHDLWNSQFGADPRIVGREIRLDDVAFTIIGVTPADFGGTNSLRNDLWTPLPARRLLRPHDPSVLSWLTSPDFCCIPMAGRLAAGASRAQAQTEIAVLVDQFRLSYGMAPQSPSIVVAGTSWIESPRKKRQVVPVILTLFLGVTLILLLACANVGNLLLARASARRQEIAVRLSLGGSRLRLIRQLLVESMLLALSAAGLGLVVAMIAPSAVVHRLAEDQILNVTPDSRVLLYTTAMAILSCLAFGLAPAFHGTRQGIFGALKTGSEAKPLERFSLRAALLSSQVAISVILLINTGLLVRGMRRAQELDPGFDVQHVMLMSIALPASQYAGPRTMDLTAELLAVLDHSADLPPVGLAMNPPLSSSNYSRLLQFPNLPGSPRGTIFFNEISGGYIDALGMHLLAGRNFVPGDAARDVVVINAAAARRWWPGENPLGQTILADDKTEEVVGVISDAYSNDLSSIEAVVYFPITGRFAVPSILVRDRSAATLDRIAAIVKQIEPRAQLRTEPLSASFSRRLEPLITAAQVAGLLGLLALIIATVGMSGVFAYVVSQRTREIGLRMALGAQPSQIVRLVLASSAAALSWGALAGIAGAGAVSAILIHTVPGIDPADPRAYLAVLVLIAIAVAVASAIPARNATRVDPVRALRCD